MRFVLALEKRMRSLPLSGKTDPLCWFSIMVTLIGASDFSPPSIPSGDFVMLSPRKTLSRGAMNIEGACPACQTTALAEMEKVSLMVEGYVEVLTEHVVEADARVD